MSIFCIYYLVYIHTDDDDMLFQKRRSNKVRLSGYGVELAVKNQEYKAKDDTKVHGKFC